MRIFLSALFLVMAQVAVSQTDVPGCTIELACNYDPSATVDDGSCDFVTCLVLGCTDASACNFNPAATVNDGSCDYLSCLVPGCTLANACNYDPAAEVNDGSCEYTSCAGCTNEFADNYDPTATVDDGSCNPIEGCTSPLACNFDANANSDDGSCDFVSCLATGCTNVEACNYDSEAQVNDGTCVFPEEGRDCDGNCLADADGDGVCDGDEVLGCTSSTAFNYNPLATDDDGSCQEPVGGCTNPEACNFDALATNDDGSCEFTSCAGCLQSSACNYDADAIYSDGSCEFPDFGYDCAGNCLNDTDGDGVCNPFEVAGCQDMMACNFNPLATDPGQCNYAAANFDCEGNSLKPIFTSFPANVTVQGWEVPLAEDAVVEAIVSPFAPGFVATYGDTALANCYEGYPEPFISYVGETRIDGVCVHDYTLIRTWTATDCAGYARTRQQIITVVDTVAPNLFVPENATIFCQDIDVADLGEASATDDCGEVSISMTSEILPGQCAGSYTIVRTFVAIDPCLNQTEGQQVIAVVDNEAPVLEAMSDVTISCDEALPTVLPNATDNCGVATVTESSEVTPGDCGGSYSVLRTFTATDDCGNSSSTTQMVTVVDDAAPEVVEGPCFGESCALNVNQLEGESIPDASLVIADNCDANATWSFSDSTTELGPTSILVIRTYTVSDDCGNSASYDQYFNVTTVLEGCLDSAACNYDSDANLDSGDCDFCSCGSNACGCMDAEACNYDAGAAYDDGSCEYPVAGYDCDGVCFDTNGNDICDIEEAGCTDDQACNYDSAAAVDDGSCDYCCGYTTFTSSEMGYGVDIDLVQTHTTGALAGLNTYRVYVTTPNADDVLTAVTGSDEFPLEIHTTTSFYQNVFGGCLASMISPAMMVVAPDAVYDSWITIGATSSADLAGGEPQLIPGAWIDSFESGNSITVDDNIGSGWYLIPPGGANGLSGADQRVLVAQLTTDGAISGSFRVQVFPEGDQVNDVRPDLTFTQPPVGAFACPVIDAGPADAVASCDDVPGLPGSDEFEVSYASTTADALGCEGAFEITLVSDDIVAGDCAGNYSITRTVELTNCAGGSAQYTYNIDVQDTAAPEFDSVPADYTVECSNDMPMDDATASDNCGTVSIEVTSETTPGNAAGNYTITRTFTATDDCGNSNSATQTITVQDTTAPEFTSVPADYTVECSDELVLDDATAQDNCDGATVTVDSEIVQGNGTGNYVVIRTFTATDDAGNSSTATQTITVQDTTAPEFTSVPADYTAECSDELVLEEASAADNCDGVVMSYSEDVVQGTGTGNYTLTRTWTATDDAGNSNSVSQTITVQDTTAPELSIPADYTAECTDELVYDDASASDNCGTVELTMTSSTEMGSCVGTKTITRTWTATDDAGNSTSATQTISVVDTTAPELSIPDDYTAECDEELVFDDATAIDNCTECNDNFSFTSTADGYGLSLELVASHESGALAGMRTYRVYLDVANADDQVTSFTGNDEFALALNTTTSFYQNAFGGATSNDLTAGAMALVPELAYDSYVTIGLTGEPQGEEGSVELIPGSWPDAFEAGQSFTVNDGIGSGWYIVPPTAVNGLGGADQRVLVAQLTTDGDLSGQFRTQVFPQGDQVNDVRADLTFTHTHVCTDVAIEVVSETTPGACAGEYTIARTFTATDDCGNSSSATQTITVQDTTAPELSIPADYAAECSDELVMDDATATDNCGTVSIEVSSETTPGACAGEYTIARTFTATDDCGNSSSATQTITVQDTTAPEFTSVPADYTAECSDELVMDDATATDNCGTVIVEVSSETTPGACAGEYTIARTFTATDDCGNSSSATQTITVQDTTAPEFTSVPADYTAECSDELVMDDATATDNCGTVSIEVSSETTPGACVGEYMIARTFTATDDCGNSTSATQTITVQDTTAPELSIPADYTIECSDVIALDDATATDNCGEVTLELVSETTPGACAGEYTITRTFTATDDCGNSSSATQTITVQDTTAPELSIPADYTAECSDELVMDDATATDNCGEVTLEVMSETTAGACLNEYTITRTFTATDDCGNSTSATQTITVQDTTAPELSIPADYTAECTEELVYDDATATDNCSEVSINVETITTPGSCVGEMTITRTFTATDGCGNSSSATQTITVQDTIAPELSIPADYTAECDQELVFDDATATDNCAVCVDDFDFTSSAAGYGLSLELVASHESGALAGMRTYRVYLDVANANDQVTSFTGNDEFALALNTTTSFYQNALGGATPNDISDAAIALVPELAYDSYVTVGLTGEPQGAEGNVELIPGTWVDAFESGQSFTVNDGIGSGWYIVPPTAVNGLGGADQRVLVAQLTTDGDLSGQFRTQVFPQGDQVNDVRADLTFAHTHTCTDIAIEVSSETTPGACAGEYTIARTFTATDDCGNSSSATQTITVQDTTAPELSIPADYTAECSDELVMDDATATDNCGTVSIEVSSETTPGACVGEYTIARTFIATDDCGNSTSATQTITVQDTTAPEFTSVPADYTAECSDELVMDDATATDNCGTVSIEVVSETTPGACAGEYTIARTFTATDDCGNSTSATQTITVQDTTAPEFTSVPADYTAECSDELVMDDATATDNCGTVSIEVSSETTPGACAGEYTIARTFTATDDCGNSSSATQTITVQDTTAPELSIPADYTAECSDELVMDDATATDNCGTVSIEVSSETTPGACAGEYTIARTFTATDDCGNSSSATQTITVQDTTAPELIIPEDYTAECSDELVMDDATATDNCGTVSIEVSSETTPGACAGEYTIARTFTATDDCGNSSSATQTITVQDTTAPEFTSVPADFTAECSDELVMDDATATDNCGTVSIEVSSETTPGACAGEYTIARTFTATDDCGNSSSATQTITVQDTTAPELSIPADYTAECSDELVMDDATATDNCGTVSIEVSSETTPGACAGEYTITRTFTATDDCGNSSSATQTITVQDTTAPELSIPADYTAECSDELVLDDATATDNCGTVSIEVSSETTPGACAGEYTITRTFTATDDCGNSSSATQTITVQDTTAPELSIPADYTAECSDELVMDDATATDNCGTVSIEVSSETTTGACAGEYTIARTFTATDDCGNSSSAIQTITVQDTTSPEFTSVPADYTAECSDELVMDDATATDNCGTVSIEVSSETTPGACAGEYTIARTFTATDDCGNSSSATQTITVQDTTAPEFTSIPADYTAECSDELVMDDATATDNCGTVSIEVSSETTPGACAGEYTIARTFTATDDCGNSSSATQTITVQDTTAPELSIPADYTAECSDELVMDDATATDNCGTVSIEVSSETTPGACAGEYTIARTFTAIDDCGNSSSATQTITVQDTTAPELSIPADYTAECSDELVMDDATATDNCGTVSIEVSSETTPGACAGEYTIARTFTATDDCGNSSSATQTITVQDTTAPELSIPADYSAECSDELVMDDATATDNCGTVSIEVSSETTPGACAGEYTIARTFTATDDCGNSSSATQTITIQDTTSPEFTSVPADYTAETGDELVLDDATATDNCGTVTISVTSESQDGDCDGAYTMIRTFTATDDCGNSSSATQTITVQDTTAPEFTSVPADYTAECSDELVMEDATATDNSGFASVTVSSETTPGACAGEYTITRTFLAEDDCGNSSSATQTILVQDTTAPEFTSVPADYTAECSDELVMDDATATDNCGTVSIEVASETTPGACAGEYTIARTFTATDDCGNSSSATQTITVQDTTAPELSIPADYTAECSDELVMDDATATDNCGTVSIEVSNETTPGACAGQYTIARTFTATDDCGNSSSATQTITVQDTTAPELSIPADYTAECTDELTLDDATATDNCGTVTIEETSETLAGDCVNGYVLVRTFTATDDCGNSSSASQTITVVDTTGPELFLPPSYEADCGDELVLLDALASDACGLALVTVEESYEYTCDNSYVLTRTFTAVDACFNETVGTQTITVTDSTAPEFTSIPADYGAECSDELVMDMATATDDCGTVDVTVSMDTLPGDCPNTYTLVRTFTATDACGNSSEATQTIDVSDTTAPEFTFVPADELIECNIGLDGTMATAVDNCGDVTVTVVENLEQGVCGGAYVITRTFTATDACGNSATAVQTITQQDTTAPTLSVAGDVTIECDDEVPAPEYTSDDACGAVTVEVEESIIPGDCPQEMTIVRTYTATDDCGNSTSAVQNIVVQDTTAPIITLAPDAQSTVYAAEGDTLADPFIVILDNCDLDPTWSVVETVLVDTPNELTVERVYTASDACGNTTTYTEVATLVLQVLGCTDDTACNYDEYANEDDDSCFYPLYGYDCDGNCLNDANDNGICDELEVAGCTDPENPGYNPEANVDDGSCLTGGCTIAFACNYDATAEYQLAGSCEFTSCAGCTSEQACNFDPDASLNNGSCVFPDYGYDCDGNCVNDADGDGICDEFEIAGCTDPSNPAYNPNATDDDGSCLVAGCLLPFACNFDPTADYLDIALCDLNSCAGCTDPASCTYDPSATLSAPAACTYPANQFLDCDGLCNNDVDGDGVCDEQEIPGCTDPAASNYSPFATDDNGTCIIEVGGCTLPFACNYDPTADFYLPGSCDFSCLYGMPPGEDGCVDELACNFGADEPCVYFDENGALCAQVGCMNEAACNFDPDAQVNSGCEYTSCMVYGCTNTNACNFDVDANTDNGSCEYASCVGCMDDTASNFDPDATLDNGQCTYDIYGCTLLIACNYDPAANVNDGSCDFTGCFGCVTPTACNYDENALYPDGSCTFAPQGLDCNGDCLADIDGDLICDANEVAGCTDGDALNYNPNATDDDGSCTFLSGGCTDQTACNFDYTVQVDDGTCEFESCSGCIVSWACNYDADATLYDGSCVFPDANGVCPSTCEFDADGDGICDANEVAGCTYANAVNFESTATDDDGSCVFAGCTLSDFASYNDYANTNNGDCTNAPNSADFNGDGMVQLEDLLEFLVAYGATGPNWGLDWIQDGCSVVAMGIAEMDVSTTGCTYPTASNYDPNATNDTGTCEWLGCTDEEAYNYNHLATMDDSSCTYNICPDFNGDGQVQTGDLLDFLIAWGSVYE